MRSKWRVVAGALVFCCCFPVTASSGLAQAAAGQANSSTGDILHLHDIVALNGLQAAGKKPYHLEVKFQVYDLRGKPQEQGTADEWWAGDEGNLLTITAPSFGTVHNLKTEGLPDDTARRSLYLVGELLQAVRSPGSAFGSNQVAETQWKQQDLAGLSLPCMQTKLPKGSGLFVAEATVCVDSQQVIRYVKSATLTLIRNTDAKFAGTQMAMKTDLAFAGPRAIAGAITTLQTFDPKQSSVTLEKPNQTSATGPLPDQETAHEGPAVTAGKVMKRVSPMYPLFARENRIAGTVLLNAVISKEGKIDSAYVVASPDPSLTEAAKTALMQWTYQPYLLSGRPVSVSTTIMMNFNINSGPR